MSNRTNEYFFDYDERGKGYSGHRQADSRIAKFVHSALGQAGTVLNIGAGTGSYEPEDRYVIPIEPSATMRAQRPRHLPPAIIGTAGALPLDDNAVDASMAILTVHHWPDMGKGLEELRRVTKGRIVIMTYDPDQLDVFWNVRYFPELVEAERRRYPTLDFVVSALGGKATIQAIPIPFDCTDGFQEAFYGRPEAFLDKDVRKAQSAWGFAPEGQEGIIVKRLADDLQSGAWDRKFGRLRTQASFTGALRLIIAG